MLLVIVIPLLLLLFLASSLFVAWLGAERRGRSISTRILLGIATMVCATTLVASAWWMYENGRETFDYRNFGDTLASLQEALHQGKSPEVERLLEEFDPTEDAHQNAPSISALREKLDLLTITSTVPAPKDLTRGGE